MAKKQGTITIYFEWNTVTPDKRAYKPSSPTLYPVWESGVLTHPRVAVLVPLTREFIFNIEPLIVAQTSGGDVPDPILTPGGMRFCIDQLEAAMSDEDEELEEGTDWEGEEEEVVVEEFDEEPATEEVVSEEFEGEEEPVVESSPEVEAETPTEAAKEASEFDESWDDEEEGSWESNEETIPEEENVDWDEEEF